MTADLHREDRNARCGHFRGVLTERAQGNCPAVDEREAEAFHERLAHQCVKITANIGERFSDMAFIDPNDS